MSEIELIIESADHRPWLRHRHWPLLRSMTIQQISVRYKQSTLALAWLFIQPIAIVAVYALFFNGILNVDGGGLPYLSFIVVGLVPWRFFAAALSQTAALADNSHVISKVYFPREMVPLSITVSGLVDLAIGIVIMFVISIAQGHSPDIHVLALPLAFAVLILVSATASVLMTTMAVFVRDINHGMPMVLQLFFFASPIMYPSSQLPSWLTWVSRVNPLAVSIESMRDILLLRIWPNWAALLPHLCIATGAFILSIGYVRSVEYRLVDVA